MAKLTTAVALVWLALSACSAANQRLTYVLRFELPQAASAAPSAPAPGFTLI
jgi:hypothetical protein